MKIKNPNYWRRESEIAAMQRSAKIEWHDSGMVGVVVQVHNMVGDDLGLAHIPTPIAKCASLVCLSPDRLPILDEPQCGISRSLDLALDGRLFGSDRAGETIGGGA